MNAEQAREASEKAYAALDISKHSRAIDYRISHATEKGAFIVIIYSGQLEQITAPIIKKIIEHYTESKKFKISYHTVESYFEISW